MVEVPVIVVPVVPAPAAPVVVPAVAPEVCAAAKAVQQSASVAVIRILRMSQYSSLSRLVTVAVSWWLLV